MQQRINLIRTIGSEFVHRKLKALALVIGIALAGALAICVWLVTISVWWWLLLVPVLAVTAVLACTYVLSSFAIRLLRPDLTNEQRKATAVFIDKLERVAETVQTPLFIIIFYVLRDVVRPRNPTYLRRVLIDGTTLRTDFADLQKIFGVSDR